MQEIARRLGGYQGNISSGTALTAVLAPLVGNKPDDELIDQLLVMPDAANAGDMERLISDWAKTTGTATWEGNRTDTTYTSETFFTLPQDTATLDELRDLINEVLEETTRTYRYAAPTLDDETLYNMQALSWLRNRDDIDGIVLRSTANMVFNADFGYWHNGTTSAPDGWTLAGSGATIARGTAFASRGPYVAEVTRVGNDATLVQDVPYALAKQLIDDLSTIAIKVRCTATVASRIRVGINNGVDTEWSSYHSGDGEPEDLTASRTLTAAASRVRIVCSVDTGDTMGSFDFAPMVEGSSVSDSDFDSLGQPERPISGVQWLNFGSMVPMVRVPSAIGRGQQLVIVTRRPFATLSTDSASTEATAEMVEHGAIYKLASVAKKHHDQTWAERLMRKHGPAYSRLARGLIELPVQEPPRPVVVTGA